MKTPINLLTTLATRLGNISPYPWVSMDAAIMEIRPVIREYFPEFLPDFELAVRAPEFKSTQRMQLSEMKDPKQREAQHARKEQAYYRIAVEAQHGIRRFLLQIAEIVEGRSKEPAQVARAGTGVFIVHGHDEIAKQSAARLVEGFGLKAIILHEQPNRGRTLIEKFETYADVAFAIVLLTADDFGGSQIKPDERNRRARQNVVFELGFFYGWLGRDRVCPLLEPGVEKPSDMDGIVYVPMDANWRTEVAKEMKAAGLSVDLNKL